MAPLPLPTLAEAARPPAAVEALPFAPDPAEVDDFAFFFVEAADEAGVPRERAAALPPAAFELGAFRADFPFGAGFPAAVSPAVRAEASGAARSSMPAFAAVLRTGRSAILPVVAKVVSEGIAVRGFKARKVVDPPGADKRRFRAGGSGPAVPAR